MEGQTIQPNQLEGFANKGAGMIESAPLKQETKTKIYYAVISCLVMGALGALGYFIAANAMIWFVCLSLLYLLLGVAHLYLLPYFKLFVQENSFGSKMGFSILLTFFSMLLFFVTFYFCSRKSFYSSLFPFTLLGLLLPLWVERLVYLALAIPGKVYKQWHYPEKPIVTDMDNIDLKNFAIITYMFSKQHGDTEKTNFQTKAPYDIRLGDLFYFFLQEWNYKYPQGNIQYKEADGKTFGWLFFVQDKWWKPKHFLDPDKTIRDNEIKVNELVKTLRVEPL